MGGSKARRRARTVSSGPWHVGALLLAALSGCAAPTPPPADGTVPSSPPSPRFEDRAKRSGIDFRYRTDLRRGKMVATMGGGVALADYDNDGDIDIYHVTGPTNAVESSGPRGNALFRNRGDGTFDEVGAAAGVDALGWSMGAVWADADGDGWLDLYVTALGPNHLYRNHGDGTFEDVAERAGVADGRFGSGAAFGDLDRDGDLDLILVNYLETTVADEMAAAQFVIKVPAEYQGQPAVLYENLGDGTFRDVTDSAGTDNLDGKGLGVRIFDHDRDGWPDIFIANDTVPNRLYRNLSGLRFEDVSLLSGTSLPQDGRARAGMGIALGDIDLDGSDDLLVTNFSSEPNTMYHGEGAGLFIDETDDRGLARRSIPYVAWGTTFLDYDNDGDEDVVIANGHLVPKLIRLLGHTRRDEDKRFMEGVYRAPVLLFRNDGTRFTDMTGQAGDLARLEVAARGLASADIDGDGDLDVVVSARDRPNPLFVNDARDGAGANHWLGVRPRMQGKNPFAIGARVELTAGGRTSTRTICAGASYLSSEPPEAHFGLGSYDRAESLKIVWPDGSETTRSDVEADQMITVTP